MKISSCCGEKKSDIYICECLFRNYPVKMVDKTFIVCTCKLLSVSIYLSGDRIKWWTMSIVSTPCPPQNAKKV